MRFFYFLPFSSFTRRGFIQVVELDPSVTLAAILQNACTPLFGRAEILQKWDSPPSEYHPSKPFLLRFFRRLVYFVLLYFSDNL